jgi:hypothetical protein
MDDRFLTSRSAVECFQDCSRYRYNQYYLGGKGLVGVQKSVPLVTGGAIHAGVEHLMNRIRIGEIPGVDAGVEVAVRKYRNDVEAVGFLDKQIKTDRQQLFTYNEQMALTEALIRAWAIVEMPRIIERYKVIHVEREIEPIEMTPGVWLQAKVDAELQDLQTKDYLNYSLKSLKQWDERSENSYKSDLQGITEMWAVEQDSARGDRILIDLVDLIKQLDTEARGRVILSTIEQTIGYFNKKKEGKKVSAVRFCILIKGARYKSVYDTNVEDLFVTHSPLIRGYKLITPTSVEFAHSFNYPNPDNKSGKGRLGKGWEPFNVWEQMGVKTWIDMLMGGGVQPECGKVIEGQVITPVEYFRSQGEMDEAIREIGYQEAEIRLGLHYLTMKDTWQEESVIAKWFPHIRKHCEFHFGGPCEYKALCWRPEVTADPIGSGLYQIRTAHHEAERLQQS